MKRRDFLKAGATGTAAVAATTLAAPSLAAAMARMPEPQPKSNTRLPLRSAMSTSPPRSSCGSSSSDRPCSERFLGPQRRPEQGQRRHLVEGLVAVAALR